LRLCLSLYGKKRKKKTYSWAMHDLWSSMLRFWLTYLFENGFVQMSWLVCEIEY
jgi:hypothetical protein